MIRVHKIRLQPNTGQRIALAQAAGTARFAYNWALNQWNEQYHLRQSAKEAGVEEDQLPPAPNEEALRRQLNAIKREQFPWMLNSPKSVVQQSIKDMGSAWKKYFDGYKKGELIGRPRLRRRKDGNRFRVDNGPSYPDANGVKHAVKVLGCRVCVPVLGSLKMRESLRFSGQVKSARISQKNGNWYISLSVDNDHNFSRGERQPAAACGLPEAGLLQHQATRNLNTLLKTCQNLSADQSDALVHCLNSDKYITGIDMGMIDLITLSDGSKVTGAKALAKHLKHKRRLSRALSRKRRFSANWYKSVTKINKLDERIANIRKDHLHKLTTYLVKVFDVIAIEDLSVAALLSKGNKSYNRSLSDCSWHELKRQLLYKSKLYESEVFIANKWFASSQICNSCGCNNGKKALDVREWECSECGCLHDRDINAAQNLLLETFNTASSAGTQKGQACGGKVGV